MCVCVCVYVYMYIHTHTHTHTHITAATAPPAAAAASRSGRAFARRHHILPCPSPLTVESRIGLEGFRVNRGQTLNS